VSKRASSRFPTKLGGGEKRGGGEEIVVPVICYRGRGGRVGKVKRKENAQEKKKRNPSFTLIEQKLRKGREVFGKREELRGPMQNMATR